MKSTLTYEMPTVAAAKLSDVKAKSKAGKPRTEKYSLRQRQKRKAAAIAYVDEFASDNSSSQPELEQASLTAAAYSTPKQAKYASARERTAAANKAKTKAAPLSKYRRKTANARERTRMREINSAFENLRHCVPLTIAGEELNTTNEKLTKITTLRLAMKYISILSEALINPSFQLDFLLECQNAGDERFMSNAPQLELCAVPPSVEPPPQNCKPAVEKSASKKSAKTKGADKGGRKSNTAKANAAAAAATPRKSGANKRQPKKQKPQKAAAAEASNAYEAICTNASASPVSTTSSATSAYASLLSATDAASPHSSTISNSSYLLDSSLNSHCYSSQLGGQSISELSSLMLESDGESLQLSEHCVSPLQASSYGSLLGAAAAQPTPRGAAALSRYDTPPSDNLGLLENPFELSLSLLGSASADSFDFAANQQPSSCLSPLVSYTDAFNPFGDLLHPDFPEHTSLDLFST